MNFEHQLAKRERWQEKMPSTETQCRTIGIISDEASALNPVVVDENVDLVCFNQENANEAI